MSAALNAKNLLAGGLTLCLLAAACLTAGPAAAAVLELAGPAGASVSVDGAVVGFLPLDPLELPAGAHEVACELPGHSPFRQTVALDESGSFLLQIRLMPLRRTTAVASNLVLAGLGQRYLGHPWRGAVYSTAELAGLAAALFGEISRSEDRKDYLLLRDMYDRAINADEIARLKAETRQAYSDMEDMEKLRDTGLLVAAGAVLVSMIDAYLTFPAVTAGPGEIPVQASAGEGGVPVLARLQGVHAGIRLTF